MMLRALKMPTIGRHAEEVAQKAEREGWTFGQYLLLLLLTDGGVDQQEAAQAAVGWGGDQYVAWREGGETCLRVSFEGDTSGDTAEIEDALDAWADGRAGAEVTTNADDQPTLTSCG